MASRLTSLEFRRCTYCTFPSKFRRETPAADKTDIAWIESFYFEAIRRVSSFIANLEIPLLCEHPVWEQIEQFLQVLSTESVQGRVAVMAAGSQNALHFHYDRRKVAHGKVHSGCTPFILNEELSAAVQWPLIWWCAAVIEAIRVKGLSLAYIDISPEWS